MFYIMLIVSVLLLPIMLFKSCGNDEGAYRISYGSFLNYTEVKNVRSHTRDKDCITYTYGDIEKPKTETYCGNNISIMPN